MTGAPLVIKGTVTKVKKVNGAPAAAGSPARNYLLVNVQVEALIRGEGGVAPVINFLMLDTGSKDFPKKKQPVLLFAQPTGTPGSVQLVSRSAIRPWTAGTEATIRAITAEVLKNDSPPAIRGIGDAFHIAGTIAGEGETQIFLKTATGAPVSLSIVRRPGQPPQWGVSLGEIVDEAAVPPARDTLLWYRLACGLPASLPPESTRTLPLIDAEAARRDYGFVMESLGRCDRTL
ncbi:MAG: hypothetical protein AB7E05_14420 [Sphingobium sp.]